MSDEMNGLQAFQEETPVPTLTLEPDLRPKEELEEKKEPQEAAMPKIEEPKLTPQEQKMVDDFANQIDLTNSSLILQYGAGAQKKMADFSGDALENVRTKDLGEIGEMLSGVVAELKDFDEEEAKGIFGIFKKTSNKLDAMKVKYS